MPNSFRVLDAGGPVIGINNRDLRTFTTRIEHTLELLPRIPRDRIVISESGITSHPDLLKLSAAGARAVLVGESLMRTADIGQASRSSPRNAVMARDLLAFSSQAVEATGGRSCQGSRNGRNAST